MERYSDLVKRLAKSLTDSGVEYAFTGAFAASFYGLPRTTVDVDVIIFISGSDSTALSMLVSALKNGGLKADEKRLTDALKSDYRIATFNDVDSGYSVDVILSSERLRRKKSGFGRAIVSAVSRGFGSS